MALTYTPKIDQKLACPTFQLPAVDGQIYSQQDFREAKVLVVMFICNHCPYVQAIEDRIIQLVRDFATEPVQFVGICANDSTEYPEDSLENLKKRWIEKQYGFPYLHDENQEVAKNFGAVCTPDIFVFNNERTLVYRGRFDDAWKDATKVKKQELREAIISILNGQNINFTPHPSMGCSIKWKSP